MKTAVSIPDDIFQAAERLARCMKRARSEIYSLALAEYVARHGSDQATEAMNAVLDEIDQPNDAFVAAAAGKALERNRW